MKQIKETADALGALGHRLRAARLSRDDTMATFGERLGVSERTVRAMEHGLPTVQIGAWLNALWILDALEPLNSVLAPRESLLDRARQANRPRWQRNGAWPRRTRLSMMWSGP
jgi:transcriptional regulator with XRE-family HTH domain